MRARAVEEEPPEHRAHGDRDRFARVTVSAALFNERLLTSGFTADRERNESQDVTGNARKRPLA